MVIVYTICDRVHTELEGGYIRNIIDVKMKEEVEKGGGARIEGDKQRGDANFSCTYYHS